MRTLKKLKEKNKQQQLMALEQLKESTGEQNAMKLGSTPESSRVIRQLILQPNQSQIDTRSMNFIEECYQEKLLDLGDRSVPSSIGFTMSVRHQQLQQFAPTQFESKVDVFDQGSQQQLNKKERNSQQSLKHLSLMVKNFIGKTQQTTYKEMADTLVQQFNQACELQPSDNLNLKRRVYDSINVMVALGVLDKKKKIITRGPIYHQNYTKVYGQEVLDNLNKQKKEILESVKVKRKSFAEMTQQMKCLDQLVTRNKKLIQDETYIQQESVKKYNFPLIFFYQVPRLMRISECPNSDNVIIQTKKEVSIFGDFDALQYIPSLNPPRMQRSEKRELITIL